MKNSDKRKTNRSATKQDKRVLVASLKIWSKDEKKRLKAFFIKFAKFANTALSEQVIASMLSLDTDNPKLDITFSPTEFESIRDIRINYMFSEVFTKQSIWKVTKAKERMFNTYKKFVNAENSNFHQNERRYFSDVPSPPKIEELIHLMKVEIAQLLDVPTEMVDGGLKMKWGPGVTKTIRGRYAPIHKTMEIPFRLPRSAFKFHSNFISSYMSMFEPDCGPFCPLESWYEFDDISKLWRVPKTSVTDRVISIEPTALVTLTLAYGQQIRNLLRKRWSVDLRNQGINQFLAHFAWSCGLATVDLSSASDSVSTGVILLLFPPYWAELILSLRTLKYFVPETQTTHTSEKTAGMGNGLTFPLETVIFHAAIRAVCKYNKVDNILCSTYGDDMIIYEELVPDLIALLTDLGFSVNTKKTHTGKEDCIRESCGKHFYKDECIDPVYIKEGSSTLNEAIRNHNRLFRWMHKHNLNEYVGLLGILRKDCPVDLYQVIEERFNLDTRQFEEVIPENDTGFLVSYSNVKNNFRMKSEKSYVTLSGNEAMWLSLMDLDLVPSIELDYRIHEIPVPRSYRFAKNDTVVTECRRI